MNLIPAYLLDFLVVLVGGIWEFYFVARNLYVDHLCHRWKKNIIKLQKSVREDDVYGGDSRIPQVRALNQ
jgi:hypothetical protein